MNASRHMLRYLFALRWYCATALVASSPAAFGAMAGFYPFAIDQDKLTGIVDFSSLGTGPLQDRDRLVVCGAQLCRAGEATDASKVTPIRLFGVTFAHDAAFPTDQEADKLVARLKRLGINLVRFHGFDTVTSVEEITQARTILLDGPFPTLNPVAVQRLKRFLAKLREAGIYADLNIHVDYTFRPGIDAVAAAFPGDKTLPTQSKPLNIFDESMIALQVKYVHALLGALGDNARNVLAIVEINNENSLLYEWATGQLDEHVKGSYRAKLESRWSAYQKTCDPSGDTLAHLPSRRDVMDKDARQCVVSFLTDLDRQYLNRMRAAIRSVLPDVILVGTQMQYGGFRNMESNDSMDMMDSHVYVDHYGFTGKFADWNTWYINDVSQFDDRLANLKNVVFYRPQHKPYMVGEYNQPWPNRQSAELIPIMAGLGSLQDWSAMVFYSYSETRDDWRAMTPREYTLDTDFAKLPTVGPMAWLYRKFEIAALADPLTIPVTDDVSRRALNDGISDTSAAFISQTFGIDTDSAFKRRIGLTSSRTAKPASRAANPDIQASNVTFDVKEGYMLLDTRSAVGYIGRARPGQEQTFRRFDIRPATTSRGFVTFIALSRDGEPLERSEHALWVLPGYVTGSKPGAIPPVPETLTHLDPGLSRRIIDFVKYETPPNRVKYLRRPRQSGYGVLAAQAPTWMERVECVVSMPHTASDVKVYPLDGTGKRMKPLPPADAGIRDGVLTVHLQRDGQAFSPWYELVFD
jgi:hypothetical protein